MAVLFKSLQLIKDDKISAPADYFFDNQSIRLVHGKDSPEADQIDCTGLYASKGWVDLKCFNGEPGLEHKEDLNSLNESLSHSGFVKAVLLPNTLPSVQTKNEVSFIRNKSQNYFSDIVIQASVTLNNQGEDLTEILDLHHHGVNVFGDGLLPISNSDRLMKILQYLQKFDGILFDHSYDPLLAIFGQMHEGNVSTRLGLKGIPSLAEEVAIQKNLEILKYAGGNLHFQTISTAGAVRMIREAKSQGLSVTADVSLYQLLFSENDLVTFDTNMKVDPPFRGEIDRVALIEGLIDGTIDAIVSNHRPQDMDAKHLEFDYASHGMLGLQPFLAGLAKLSVELPWPLLISKVTSGPLKVLREEAKADFWTTMTVFDPQEKWVYDRNTNKSLSQNSPWWENELQGKVKYVINGSKFLQCD
ncbi:dihydroorotase [Anditalea andensis]|uniref:Dihydroorotase n=1 Tax=Anditalea andensis TaxID=1048983 RepID=A0A074LKG9_9BACT|nr:dihydroorotase [Anditalea andensis]KEO74332.1 dihydroorotase [Anditalea andensis]